MLIIWWCQKVIFYLHRVLINIVVYVKFYVMEDSKIKNSKVVNSTLNMASFNSLACLCGLSFPETATEFQKAFLTLAHLCAILREQVLKGNSIPLDLIRDVRTLSGIVYVNFTDQK